MQDTRDARDERDISKRGRGKIRYRCRSLAGPYICQSMGRSALSEVCIRHHCVSVVDGRWRRVVSCVRNAIYLQSSQGVVHFNVCDVHSFC